MRKHLISLGLALAVSAPVYAASFEDILNATRNAKGRSDLVMSDKLNQAAKAHALDMVRNGFFAHKGSDGSSVSSRVRRQGYRYCFVGENLAYGYGSADAVMRGWMKSPSHRRNTLDRRAREFGIARAQGDIWVLVLGRTSGC